MSFWGSLVRFAAPVVGGLVGGPLGGLAGGALGSLVGRKSGSGAPASSTDLNNRYLSEVMKGPDVAGATDALKTMTSAAVNNAMPDFRNQLQMTREDAIRRGVSTGDYGTSKEGDLASAFDRNVANSVAGQAGSLYDSSQNRYLDLLTGGMDRQTAEENAKRQAKGNTLGGLFQGAGEIAGALPWDKIFSTGG